MDHEDSVGHEGSVGGFTVHVFRWSLCYILVPRYVAHKGGGVDMSGW